MRPWYLTGCAGAKDALSDDPVESYCESICTWAVDCATDARDADADALMEECLAATRSVNASCGDAESGELNAAQKTALAQCTDAIADQAGECDGISGLDAQVVASTPPAACGGQSNAQDTYRAAQDAVIESGDELCDRFYDEVCEVIAGCIESTTGYDGSATGVPPKDACMTALSGQLGECSSSGKYDRSDTANPDREAAQECLAGMEDPTCGDVLSGNIPASCVTAIGTADDVAALGEVIQQYATR